MKYPIQVSYTFQILSKPITEDGCVCRGSISVYFEGEYEFNPEPLVGDKIAIVPPSLRMNCGGGVLPVIDILFLSYRENNRHTYGYTRKGFKLRSMSEQLIARENQDVVRCKDLAKKRIAGIVIPYMLDVVGLRVIGEVPYYREW